MRHKRMTAEKYSQRKGGKMSRRKQTLRKLSRMEKEGRPFRKKERLQLYELAGEGDKAERVGAVRLLGWQYHPKSEKFLQELQTRIGKKDDIRPWLAEALSIGRTKRTLEMLWRMAEDKKRSVRKYAADSHFEVFMNVYGYQKKTCARYLLLTEGRWKQEKDPAVRAVWHKNRYLAGDRQGYERIFSELSKCCKRGKKSAVWEILGVLEKMAVFRNTETILKSLEKVETYPILRNSKRFGAYKEKIQEDHSRPIALFLDQKNEGVTHILKLAGEERLSNCIWFRSYGISCGKRLQKEAQIFLRDQGGVKQKFHPIPQPVSGLWECDCLIPVGIHLKQKDFMHISVLQDLEEYRLEGEETWEDIRVLIDRIGNRVLETLLAEDFREMTLKLMECLQVKEDAESMAALRRLAEKPEDREIRFLAVRKYFDVFISSLEYRKETFAQYTEQVRDIQLKEQDRAVKAMYLGNSSWFGDEKIYDDLGSILHACILQGDKEDFLKVLDVFYEIKTIRNENIVNAILKREAKGASGFMAKELKEARFWKPPVYVLVVGKDGERLWDLCDQANRISHGRICFREAVYLEKTGQTSKLCEVSLLNYKTEKQTFALQAGVRDLVHIDWILPIGIKLKSENFPCQKICRYFEIKSEETWKRDTKKAAEIMSCIEKW